MIRDTAQLHNGNKAGCFDPPEESMQSCGTAIQTFATSGRETRSSRRSCNCLELLAAHIGQISGLRLQHARKSEDQLPSHAARIRACLPRLFCARIVEFNVPKSRTYQQGAHVTLRSRVRFAVAWLAIACLWPVAVPALAHHSFGAEYDGTK